jgi:hypothetical protein
MASISIIALPGWGNCLFTRPGPLAALRHRGAVGPCAWSSPFIAWRVQAPGPVHPRFLVRLRLLTRLYPLPAHRAKTFFP